MAAATEPANPAEAPTALRLDLDGVLAAAEAATGVLVVDTALPLTLSESSAGPGLTGAAERALTATQISDCSAQ